MSGINGADLEGDLLQDVQQDLDGIERGEDGDAVLGGDPADAEAVVAGGIGVAQGVQDVGHVTGAQGVQDLLGAGADLGLGAGADAVILQVGGGAGGGLDVEAQVVEPADQGQGVLFVLVGDGDEEGAIVGNPGAAGLERLVESASITAWA